MTTQHEIDFSPRTHSQCEVILQYLKNGGRLTVAEALTRFGIFALSQRCTDLRREGHPVKSDWVKRNGKRFAEYYYENKVLVDCQEVVEPVSVFRQVRV